MCTIFDLNTLTQFGVAMDANVVFSDPNPALPSGTLGAGFPIPPVINQPTGTTTLGLHQALTIFPTMYMWNKTQCWGAEMLYMRRFHRIDEASTFDMFLGARWVQFNEDFLVRTLPGSTTNMMITNPFFSETVSTKATGDTLGSSYWDTWVHNNIVGPEVAARWSRGRGRWKFTLDGRFTAGLNSQNVQQNGELGRDIAGAPSGYVAIVEPNPNDTVTGTTGLITVPLAPGQILDSAPSSFASTARATVFSPVVDLRAILSYKLTKAVNFKVEWEGMWLDNIARPSSLVNYRVSGNDNGQAGHYVMGIDMGGNNNLQSLIMTGVNVGIEINR
jgi:hypothetical protein